MKKKYEFKVKLKNEGVLPLLNIKSLTKTYPVDFSEINVPIIFNKDGGEICYCLDFNKSYDSKGNNYKKSYLKRDKQKQILNILEEKIGEDIIESIDKLNSLSKNGKKIIFSLDDGFNPGRP